MHHIRFIAGLLLVTLAVLMARVSVEADNAPLYLKLPMGVQAKVVFERNGEAVLTGETDVRGQFYEASGLPAGSYQLYVDGGTPETRTSITIDLSSSPHGLANVLRPEIVWVAPLQENFISENIMGPKLVLALLMLSCLVIMLLILKKRGVLEPLLQSLRERAPEFFRKRLKLPLDFGQRMEPAESVSMSMDFRAYRNMERKLAQGKGIIAISGELLEKARDWGGDLGVLHLTRQIHTGGVGAIYEGYGEGDPSRRLALKLPLSTTIRKANNRHDLESIRTEFGNNHDLSGSSKLVQFYELRRFQVIKDDVHSDVYMSIMEYIDGFSLDVLLKHGKDFEFSSRRVVMREVMEALWEVHEKGKLHNDIKPENVMVIFNQASKTVSGVRLIDFGGQVRVDPDDPQRARKITPDYSSPEVLAGQPPTVSSDIFSLGLLCYELFEGQLPYTGEPQAQICSDKEFELRFQHLNGNIALQNILRRMLVKNSLKRPYTNLGEIIQEVKAS